MRSTGTGNEGLSWGKSAVEMGLARMSAMGAFSAKVQHCADCTVCPPRACLLALCAVLTRPSLRPTLFRLFCVQESKDASSSMVVFNASMPTKPGSGAASGEKNETKKFGF